MYDEGVYITNTSVVVARELFSTSRYISLPIYIIRTVYIFVVAALKYVSYFL